MKRIALVLAVIIGIAMFAPSAAQAGIGTVRVNNQSYWKNSPMGEVKLRAEVKHRTDCAGPNVSDTYDTRKSTDNHPHDLVGNVVEVGNDHGFYIKIVGN